MILLVEYFRMRKFLQTFPCIYNPYLTKYISVRWEVKSSFSTFKRWMCVNWLLLTMVS